MKITKETLQEIIREELKSLNERTRQLPRQLKDKKKEMMVVKNGKVQVIDKKDWNKYKRKGYLVAENESVSESYSGNMSDFKYDFESALSNMGISGKAIKKISKKGKRYEVRLSSYMNKKETWEKLGKEIGANLVDFKPGRINIGLYESVVNEENRFLNKKVKKYLDGYLKGQKKNSPEHQHAIMLILKGALTDANYHSWAKRLDKFFPKAKQSKYFGTEMEDVIEDKGIDIARLAEWDGYDIVDAFSFYTSMTLSGGFGQNLKTLKESVNEAKLKPKKLTQLKRGEKFVFNNTPYEFIELYPSIKSAAKVKTQDGKTSVVSFGGGVVNKNTKGGFSDYLDKGGRIWDNVNIGDESVNEAKKFTVKKLGDDYYPYGLYYDNKLVSGLKSNSKKEVENSIKSISKVMGIKETNVNESNIISKLNKVKSELSPLSSLYIQSIIDDKGVIEDLNNTGDFVTIEDIKLWNLPKYGNRLTLTYRFYNKKFENGGYQTIASFYGDVDEILSNIEHLIFDVVRFKKKKFEDIKIDFKINNRVAKKWRYANRFNEALRESVNEANAVTGGKIHKFITGKNLTYKGKKYSDIEFELLGIDNNDKLVKLKILAPKNFFGHEMKVPFKTIRRGPFIKTDTSK